MPPPVEVFLTTIVSSPALRQKQEYILRVLQVKKIPFTSYDLASDEDAKKLWKRKAPLSKQQPPGLLVGGVYPGGYAEFEEAVECEDLDRFLRRDEEWDEELFGPSKKLEVKPVGVPGAYSPLEMNPSHKPAISPHPTPTKPKDGSRGKEIDIGEELSEYGLEGVTVDEQDLMDLVSELIGEEGAGELVKGFKAPGNKKKEEVTEEVEKKGHDAVVQELAGKLKDVELGGGKGKPPPPPSTGPEPDTKPTEGPPEIKQKDNLVTEATPSDADKATS